MYFGLCTWQNKHSIQSLTESLLSGIRKLFEQGIRLTPAYNACPFRVQASRPMLCKTTHAMSFVDFKAMASWLFGYFLLPSQTTPSLEWEPFRQSQVSLGLTLYLPSVSIQVK